MENPELTLTVLDRRRTSIRTSEGREAEGTVELEALREATIAVFQDLLARKRMDDRRAFEVLGRHLYEVLFSGRVEQIFDRAYEESREADRRLRVQLSFMDDAAELASLPWEYLFHQKRGAFFSTAVDLVLSRFVRLDEEQELSLNPGEDRLRILIVVSEPEELAGVLPDPVIEAIEKLRERHPIDVIIQKAPTVDNLVDSLRETRPHILHFIGHGKFEDRRGSIALLQPDGKSVLWCDDATFGEYLVQAGVIPRLVVLHLCEGGRVELNANFAGLVPQLVRKNVQAVVAMQHPITNLDAIAFSRAFYEEIARGSDVDHAVQMGRWRMTTARGGYISRGFGTPVLYMRSRTGIIMAPPAAEGSATRRFGTPPPRRVPEPSRGGASGGNGAPMPTPGEAPFSRGPSATLSEGRVEGAALRGESYFGDAPPGASDMADTGLRSRSQSAEGTPLRRLQTSLLNARTVIRGLPVDPERKNHLLARLGEVERALLGARERPDEWAFIVLDFATGEVDQEFVTLLDGITTALQEGV